MRRDYLSILLLLLTQESSLKATTSHEYLPISVDQVNDTITQKLDQHSSELAQLARKIHMRPDRKHGVWKFDWLPGFYVKYNIIRIANRTAVARCVKEHNLTLLHVPEKYAYHIKGRPSEFNSLNYLVVCEEVIEDRVKSNIPLTKKHVEQLLILIEKSGYCSTFSHNFIRCSDDRLSLIDMDGTFSTAGYLKGLIGLLFPDLSSYYTCEALELIIEKIASKLASLDKKEQSKLYELALRVLTRNNENRAFQVITDIETRVDRLT